MRLHYKRDEFEELIQLTSDYRRIPMDAVKRDYYITLILHGLSKSEYVEEVVFKGGTSLSKCYPGSIERFSEDIDLTYLPADGLSEKQINKMLKKIEECLIGEAKYELIVDERNNRNKSAYVWFNDEDRDTEKIKLEIGSSVRPDPYVKKMLRSYIHDYLIFIREEKAIAEYNLLEVEINVLMIERTFIDKLFSVKRHAICGNLHQKVRHIYDVAKLFETPEIKQLLIDGQGLKKIVKLTKETDSFYLEKRGMAESYNPMESYNFQSWRKHLTEQIRNRYENLHTDLLYTDEKQNFDDAIEIFEEINNLLVKIDE